MTGKDTGSHNAIDKEGRFLRDSSGQIQEDRLRMIDRSGMCSPRRLQSAGIGPFYDSKKLEVAGLLARSFPKFSPPQLMIEGYGKS
jgi:hypothetical protein